MLILGIESSCDETGVSLLNVEESKSRAKFKILSNEIASSVGQHALYGGVVPEIASRAHAEAITPLCYRALEKASVTMNDIDAVSVTAFPGLIGALLVGVNFAKSLAYAYNKPIVPVNHIMGHIASCYLCDEELKPPFFAMVTSGGHCSMLKVDDYTKAETLGRTRDDAVGECFDKVARVMGMPYPGGAEMDRIAYLGNPDAIVFPSAAISGDTLDLSFSGLKTAVLNYLNSSSQKGIEINKNDISASFTKAVCSSIIKKLELAHERYHFDKFVLSGGVSANSHLRAAVLSFGQRRGIKIYMPERSLCGDNGAMIAAQGYYEYIAGNTAGINLNASSCCDI